MCDEWTERDIARAEQEKAGALTRRQFAAATAATAAAAMATTTQAVAAGLPLTLKDTSR